MLFFKFHQNRTIDKKIYFFEEGTANSEDGRVVIAKKKIENLQNAIPK